MKSHWDRLQTQRFEIKYLVNATTAWRVRDSLATHLLLDEYSQAQPHHAYPVYSLYLDSDARQLYWDTINGNRNRYKLRVRYYDTAPEAPLFLEIKSRLNDAILKKRAIVSQAALADILAGRMPDESLVKHQNGNGSSGLEDFVMRIRHLVARPAALVTYHREAWCHPENNSLRITIDNAVNYQPMEDVSWPPITGDAVPVFGEWSVLEIKFTSRYPNWVGDLIREFDLRQCSAAKYADGATRAGGLAPADVAMRRLDAGALACRKSFSL
ncbi:MAG: polyphosphate polymerase domain-containing protein [Pedosphaera sp.]|nr:polyphosphate polymerase domain-containing protein [Pedosphaera sp.]MSU43236.1 polyphosphate polymerase domain-containing protein [Pedosphaera sp.]